MADAGVYADTDQNVVWVNSDGTEKWSNNIAEFVYHIAVDGNDPRRDVYFCTASGNFHRLNGDDGTAVYSTSTQLGNDFGCAVGPDYALATEDGDYSVMQKSDGTESTHSSPSGSAKEAVYSAEHDSFFVAVNSGGILEVDHSTHNSSWFVQDSSSYWGVSADETGAIYASTDTGGAGTVTKWNSSATEQWSTSVGDCETVSCGINYVYAVTNDGSANAEEGVAYLNRSDGTFSKTIALNQGFIDAVAITPDGTGWIGAGNGVWTSQHDGTTTQHHSTDSNGVASTDGRLGQKGPGWPLVKTISVGAVSTSTTSTPAPGVNPGTVTVNSPTSATAGSTPTPSVSPGVVPVAAPVSTSTVSTPSPSVNPGPVTVNVDALDDLGIYTPAPTLNATATINASTSASSSSTPNPGVSPGTAPLNAATTAISAASPAPGLTPGGVTLDALETALSSSTPNPTVSPGATTMAVPTSALTGSTPLPDVTLADIIDAAVSSLTSSTPAPTLSPGVVTLAAVESVVSSSTPSPGVTPSAVTLAAPETALTASTPLPTLDAVVSLSAPVTTTASSTPNPGVNAVATLAPPTSASTSSTPTPTLSPGAVSLSAAVTALTASSPVVDVRPGGVTASATTSQQTAATPSPSLTPEATSLTVATTELSAVSELPSMDPETKVLSPPTSTVTASSAAPVLAYIGRSVFRADVDGEWVVLQKRDGRWTVTHTVKGDPD